MAHKTYDVKLSFTADTSRVKGQLDNLSKSLKNLSTNSNFDGAFSKEIASARKEVAALQLALEKAVNVDTGKLDLFKFNQSLKYSGTSIERIRQGMEAFGKEGIQAFAGLTKSIMNAQAPTLQWGNMLGNLMKTLANTARWQISSKVLYGFTGAIQSAYSYAQDLNKSLNDIRIVTGLNTKQMDEFAKSANKSARALSTTTNEYAKASLIFYQQGLDENAVKKRTDTVIKMANVTGDSAEDVSSYMTAIWNNFAQGAENLEHYADVITKLGAATASSSAEIAGGLEKFAAIADTVGLSYEYAATALATVVANTRQSEETVGTAFKTIFGRLQSLNLGETLDDDTTLTKYSNALATVGVNIKEQSGELRAMDDILDDLGAKWAQLSAEQKTALANTVAGTRQYSNFIALMDSYQTSFQDNLKEARNAEGELQNQADIYAESWEAAKNRARAAAEAVYTSLFDDDMFITLSEWGEGLADIINVITKGVGGLNGALSLAASLMLNMYSKEAAQGLERVAFNIGTFFGVNKNYATKQKQAILTQYDTLWNNVTGGASESSAQFKVEKQIFEQELELRQKIADTEKNRTETGRVLLENQISMVEKLEEELRLNAEKQDLAQKKYGVLTNKIMDPTEGYSTQDISNIGIVPLNDFLSRYVNVKHGDALTHDYSQFFQNINFEKISKAEVDKWSALSKQYTDNFQLNTPEAKEKVKEAYVELIKLIDEYHDNMVDNYVKKIKEVSSASEEEIREYVETRVEFTKLGIEGEGLQQRHSNSIKSINNSLDDTIKKHTSWAQVTVQVAQGLTGLTSAAAQFASVSKILNDDSLSLWEKLASLTTTLGFAITSLTSSLNSLSQMFTSLFGKKTQDIILTEAQAKAQERLNQARKNERTLMSQKEQGDANVTDDMIQAAKNATQQAEGDLKNANKAITKSSMQQNIGIAVAVAAIMTVISVASAQLEKYENNAKSATKVAEQAKAAFESTKRTYEELKSATENYSKQKEGLETMVKGTLKWRDAIQSANEEARKLIEAGDLIYGKDYEIGADGLITFKTDENGVSAEDRALETQMQKRQQAEAAQLSAQAAADNARAKSNRTDFNRDLNSGSDSGQNWGNAAGAGLGGAIAGAGIAAAVIASGGLALIPLLIGAGIGAAVGLAGGGIASNVIGTSTDRETKAVDKLVDFYSNATEQQKEEFNSLEGKALEEFLRNEIKIDDEKLIQSLVDNENELKKLVSSEAQLAAENIALQKQMLYLNGNFEEYFGDSDSEKSNYMAEMFATKTAYGTDIANKIITDWGKDGDDLKTLVSEITNGQYKIKDVNNSHVTLIRINDDGTEEVIGEENNYDKDSLLQFLYNQYVNSDAFLETEEAVKIREEASKKWEQAYTQVQGKNILSDSSNSIKLEKVVSQFALGKQIDLSEFTRDEAMRIMDLYKNSSSEFGKELYKAASEWEDVFVKRNLKSTQQALETQESRKDSARKQYLNDLGMGEGAYKILTQSLQANNEALRDNTEAAQQLADVTLRSSSHITGINKVVKDNLSMLERGDVNSSEFAKTIATIGTELTKIFGVTLDYNTLIDRTFRGNLIKAAEGDMVAYGAIAKTVAETINAESGASEPLISTVDSLIQTLFAATPEERDAILSNFNNKQIINDAIASGNYDYVKLEQILQALGFDVAGQVTYDSQGKAQYSLDWDKTAYVGYENVHVDPEEIRKKSINQTVVEKRAVEKLNKEYEKLANNTERAYGKNKLQGIQAQIDKTNELIDAQEKLILAEEKETALYKQQVIDYFKSQGISESELKWDAYGNLTNYNDLRNSLNEAGQEGLDQVYGDYDKQLEEEADAREEKINLQGQIVDLQLDADEHVIEVKATISELTSKELDLHLARLGDGEGKASQRMSLYGSQFVLGQYNYNEAYQNYQSALTKEYNSEEERIKAIEEATNKVIEEEQALMDLAKTYRDEFSSAISAAEEKIDNQIAKFSTLKELLDSFSASIQLLGTEMLPEANELIKSINETNLSLIENSLTAEQENFNAIQSELANARAKYAEAIELKDDSAIKQWEAEIERLEAASLESTTKIANNFQEALTLSAEIFKNNIQFILEDMENILASSFSGSYDYMQFMYNQQKNMDDLYLDEYERNYEIDKLNRHITKSINSTIDIKGKQKLQDIQKKLNELSAENAEISAQQVELLQKEYEAELALIELEEARNSKNQVRLVQSESGAWSYVYTANEAAIEDAEQAYKDKMYDIEKTRNDFADGWIEQIMNLMSSTSGDLNQLLEMDFKSIDEQNAAIAQFFDNRIEQINSYISLLNNVMGGNTSLAGTIFASFGSTDNLLNTFINQLQTSKDQVLAEAIAHEGRVDSLTEKYAGEGGLVNLYQTGISEVSKEGIRNLDAIQTSVANLKNTYVDLSNSLIAFEKQFLTSMETIRNKTDEVLGEFKTAIYSTLGEGAEITSEGLILSVGVKAASARTGGYTGEWGNSGKLAILHEKELILNKYDTENMLSAINVIRDLETKGLFDQNNIPSFDNSIVHGLLNSLNLHQNDTLEQVVTIQAEFPNAVNHSEIEQAFENIVNMASQYARRK